MHTQLFLVSESYFIGALLHNIAHVQIISETLKNINLQPDEDDTVMSNQLHKCIDESVKTIEIINHFEGALNIAIFMANILVTFLLCTLVSILPEVSFTIFYYVEILKSKF